LHVDPVVGIAGERRFAIKRRVDQPDKWAPKVHFRVCMNTPQLAAQTPEFVVPAEPEDGLDPRWVGRLAAILGEPELVTIDTKGAFNLVDTDPREHGPTISFLNLASVRALQRETGWTIEPERFRMNIWYDDGEPFSELAFADSFPGTRSLEVGSLQLRLQDACERCQAIEANPNTGERDLPLLDALAAMLKKLGYRGSPHRGSFHVMGFLATPLTEAIVTRGQEIRLL
jgi:uncharacterized protein YcbX